ncbi:hypothetical protein HON36_04155 [Candidatus Parcubacteria bacterium]|jgi:hypothetical protein|nr:hypothetical protein [Candidatus Parcubacteria bacterium]
MYKKLNAPGTPKKNKKHNKGGVMVLLVIITALLVGGIVYTWQQASVSSLNSKLSEIKNEAGGKISELEKEVEDLEKEVEVKEKEVEEVDLKAFYIPEANLSIEFPNKYTISKSLEEGRRGSFASYDFLGADSGLPNLMEIQFFSEGSIKICEAKAEENLCFMGDYPTSERYQGQRQAFAGGQDYEKYKLDDYAGTKYFSYTRRVVGDGGYIREYTTFISDTKIDIIVYIGEDNKDLIDSADWLLENFKFLEKQTNIFDVMTAEVGDEIVDMEIVSIAPFKESFSGISYENAEVKFSGQVNVIGEYHYNDIVASHCVYSLDEISDAKLPKIDEDTRTTSFCFINSSEVQRIFGPYEDGEIANVIIDSYTIISYPSAVANTVEFIELGL